MVRDGSWINDPWTLRASFRSRDGPGTRNDSLGFRLAHPLNPLPSGGGILRRRPSL
ncbi:MAG: hypothetical protein LC729_00405, partial [Acidobacteria bacterium]|nr:hypothetical protein [Acidobacteriota bacterium]